jgi:hypothetical protein
MSIPLNLLQTFQQRNLEVEEKPGQRVPKLDRVIEWALIEITIQLTALKQSLQSTPQAGR